jgi:hypothetical protein
VEVRFKRTLCAFYGKSGDDLIVGANRPAFPVSQDGSNGAFKPLDIVRLVAVLGVVKQRQGSFNTNAIANFHKKGINNAIEQEAFSLSILSYRQRASADVSCANFLPILSVARLLLALPLAPALRMAALILLAAPLDLLALPDLLAPLDLLALLAPLGLPVPQALLVLLVLLAAPPVLWVLWTRLTAPARLTALVRQKAPVRQKAKR